jgi:rubrerythrin
MQPPPVVAGQLLQRTPSETDPALSKEDQVRRMFAPELEMEVRDKLCANIYGEDQLWEDLRREEQIDIDGKAELWARSDLNSVIDKVLEAEGRAKVAAQAAQKKSATAAQLHVYKWRCAVCGNSDANKFQKIEGNVVCMGKDFVPDPDEPNKLGSCGTVVQSVDPFEGSFYRKFEGEEDRSHHCAPANPLFGEAWNSRTGTNFDGVGGGKSTTALRNDPQSPLPSPPLRLSFPNSPLTHRRKHPATTATTTTMRRRPQRASTSR